MVRMFGQLRKEAADEETALSVLGEWERRSQQPAVRSDEIPRPDGHQFPMIPKEAGLVVKGIDLRRSPMHEEKYHPPGPCWKKWHPRGEGASLSCRRALGHIRAEAGETKPTEAASSKTENVTAGND